MTEITENPVGQHVNRRRIAIWGIAAFILALPAVAMQFTDEVVWSLGDFMVFGAMLIAACGAYELATRMTGNNAYRAAVAVAVATAFILVWVNLAVGIIGNEGSAANLMYYGVLAVGIVGAILARFRPQGMVRALVATAIAQTLVTLIALMLPASASWGIILFSGFFVVLWLASAWLFRIAANQSLAAAEPPHR